MNFIRENHQTAAKKRKISSKDINFFQTVREGTRRYDSNQEGTRKEKILFSKGNTSGSSVMGKTLIRPTRSGPSTTTTTPRPSVLEIIQGLDSESSPTPHISSNPLPEARSFFSSEVSFPHSKGANLTSNSFWGFNEDEEITNLRASTSFSSPQKPATRNPDEGSKSHMYIEERAETECSNFRANIQRFKPEREAESAPGSPEIVDPPVGLEGYGLSPLRVPLKGAQNLPEKTPSSTVKTPSGLVSSTGFQQLSPFLPPPSSSFSTGKTFFSDAVPDPVQKGGTTSFFKTPPTKPSLLDEQYESLFSTPGKVKSLPRITTPQLFLPYQKSTPSKTTPQTKSSLKTPSTSQDEPFYVISVTEGRGLAMCEVGIAAIDLNHPILCLSQFSDSQTYKKTLAKINIINPAEMLIPDTFKGQTPSVLYKTVTETFPDMRVMTVKRQHFSAKLGLETIRSLLLPDSSSVEMIIHRRYYTLAAAEALMKFIEIKHGKLFAPKSLKVSYQSANDVVSIDLESCQRLEVVMSNAEMVFPEKYSLFGLINHTKTLGGRRRLRISLLQPFSSPQVIHQTQAAVTALLNDQRALQALQTNLLKFSNVERLLWLCLKSPNLRNEVKTFETLTNYVLLLKTSLEALPHLRNVLKDIDNDHIINIRDELSDPRYDAILARILTMIQEDARPARGFAEAERQRCFAIKDGINDLLDVARATYSDLIQQVMDNISDLAREHSLPLKMVHSADFGFHPSFTLPKNTTFHKEDIPEIFTEVKQKNQTIHLLTEEIYVYNMRIKRALQEIQLITNVVIYDLVESLRDEIGLLYRFCEHVSELDFLACLAQVSSTPDYTKPTFGEQISLVGARHPILDLIRPNKPIPNTVFASKKKNFNIITGPNMGGKTVYVLMIPLIQIMAQIGCYVPADKAEIRIADHIYVKKGSGDCIERKVSSYSKEVQELTYTVTNISESSLIILDEICTGTLSDIGTAMAWGFCEELLKGSAFTFLTTHYHYLTNLSKIYKNVTNYNMEAIERNPDDTGYGALTFTYRLIPGVTQSTNYGLRLLMSSGLPDHIKKNAVEIVEDLARKRASTLPLVVPDTPNTSGLHSKIEKIENFMTNLYGLSMTDNFTPDIISTLQKMAIEEILSDDENDDEMELGCSNTDKRKDNKISESCLILESKEGTSNDLRPNEENLGTSSEVKTKDRVVKDNESLLVNKSASHFLAVSDGNTQPKKRQSEKTTGIDVSSKMNYRSIDYTRTPSKSSDIAPHPRSSSAPSLEDPNKHNTCDGSNLYSPRAASHPPPRVQDAEITEPVLSPPAFRIPSPSKLRRALGLPSPKTGKSPSHPPSPQSPSHPPYSQSTSHPPYSQSPSHPPYPQSPSHPPYSQSTSHPPYPQSPSHPPYPQSTSHPPYSQSTSHPPYSQSTSHPPYPQSTSHPPYPQSPGFLHLTHSPSHPPYPQSPGFLHLTHSPRASRGAGVEGALASADFRLRSLSGNFEGVAGPSRSFYSEVTSPSSFNAGDETSS